VLKEPVILLLQANEMGDCDTDKTLEWLETSFHPERVPDSPSMMLELQYKPGGESGTKRRIFIFLPAHTP
jgi:hypothetical protein